MSPRTVLLTGTALVLFAAVAGLVIGPATYAAWLLAVAAAAGVVGLLAIGSVLTPTRSSFYAARSCGRATAPGGGA